MLIQRLTRSIFSNYLNYVIPVTYLQLHYIILFLITEVYLFFDVRMTLKIFEINIR